jgi:hypothetical protein
MDTSLSPKELDVQRMLACEVHIGTRNVDFQMERYVWRRRADGARAAHSSVVAPTPPPRSPPSVLCAAGEAAR